MDDTLKQLLAAESAAAELIKKAEADGERLRRRQPSRSVEQVAQAAAGQLFDDDEGLRGTGHRRRARRRGQRGGR
mgnify:CR=1 FL=1